MGGKAAFSPSCRQRKMVRSRRQPPYHRAGRSKSLVSFSNWPGFSAMRWTMLLERHRLRIDQGLSQTREGAWPGMAGRSAESTGNIEIGRFGNVELLVQYVAAVVYPLLRGGQLDGLRSHVFQGAVAESGESSFERGRDPLVNQLQTVNRELRECWCGQTLVPWLWRIPASDPAIPSHRAHFQRAGLGRSIRD